MVPSVDMVVRRGGIDHCQPETTGLLTHSSQACRYTDTQLSKRAYGEPLAISKQDHTQWNVCQRQVALFLQELI